MDWTSVQSSQIREIGYDNTQRVIGVKFKGKNPQTYLYEGPDVTAELFDQFLKAPSKGKFLAERIKKASRIAGRKVST